MPYNQPCSQRTLNTNMHLMQLQQDVPARSKEMEMRMKRRRPSGTELERLLQAVGLGNESFGHLEVGVVIEILLKDADYSVVAQEVEKIFDKQVSDHNKIGILERCQALGLQLQDVAGRLAREHATQHNSMTWPLTADLTIKVFSLLDTRSVCNASAVCTTFNKLAMESPCYVDVDLTTSDGEKVTNRTVAKFIHRAGCNLRTLKLGAVSNNKVTKFPSLIQKAPRCGNYELCTLTKSCLEPLVADNGAAGVFLRGLHLFNVERVDTETVCKALSVCPHLRDLELIGLNVSMKTLITYMALNCHSLERLCCQPAKWLTHMSDTDVSENIKTLACHQLVKGCPNLASLALRKYRLRDCRASVLFKGLKRLKHVDFSGTDALTGSFLEDVIGSSDSSLLQTLILRNCFKLSETMIEKLFGALYVGECKSLQYLDISNSSYCSARWFNHSFMLDIARIRAERPDLQLVANYTPAESRSVSEEDTDTFEDTDESLESFDYDSEDTTNSNSSGSW